MNKHCYAVIMAGGIGSRFWPMSRTKHPKQFIDVLGTGKTLIQQTFDRLNKLCPSENIYVVTNAIYENLVLKQLPIDRNQVLCEPSMKNTAPCIAYAAFKIHQKDSNASMIVAPSDHLILDEEGFLKKINKSLEAVISHDILITLGIQPSRPDTGYGYIQFSNHHLESDLEVKKVSRFTEKPHLELAEQFLSSGNFLWNSGIFIWSTKSILKRLKTDLSELHNAFTEGQYHLNTEKEKEFINSIYPSIESISIDFGIMEKADNVFVIPADFGWSDLGTFGSLYTHITKDNSDNASISKNVMLYNSSKNMIHSNSDKLIVIDGLEDYIIVDQKDVLLICKKENEQMIKQYTKDVKEKIGENYI